VACGDRRHAKIGWVNFRFFPYNSIMDVNAQCELGQRQLMAMDYLAAEKTLTAAEAVAWESRDFDALSRLYMPLQEARRQRRQRCGEGVVCLDLLAQDPDDKISGRHIVENFPHGQLLVAGWGSIQPAIEVRKLQAELGLFVETFLAAVYPVGAERVVAIVPLSHVSLPRPEPRSIDALVAALPAQSIVLPVDSLPKGAVRGTPQTYGRVMALWEQLHSPFLATADSQGDLLRRIEAYRTTIQVDYACELAHQKLSDVAKMIERGKAQIAEKK
jgi:hypothetical protein